MNCPWTKWVPADSIASKANPEPGPVRWPTAERRGGLRVAAVEQLVQAGGVAGGDGAPGEIGEGPATGIFAEFLEAGGVT